MYRVFMRWDVDDHLETVLDGVREAHIRVVAGEVRVAAGDCPSHLLVERLGGAPLIVEVTDGMVEIEHGTEGRWPQGSTPQAFVRLTVPASADVAVTTASASVLLAGMVGETSIRTASGDVVLERTGGNVRARTASGDIAGRQATATLRCETVSGDLTLASGAPPAISAKTVSGAVLLDVTLQPAGEYELASVSGDVALRLDDDAGARVDARSVSGRLDSAFQQLHPERRSPVGRSLCGQVGAGDADLSVRTVSGDIALLRALPA